MRSKDFEVWKLKMSIRIISDVKFIHWSFRRFWIVRYVLYCISSWVLPRISMSDTLTGRDSNSSATKICDFRNQDFEILVPTYASLELFLYCLGLYLGNGFRENWINWIPSWLQICGTKVVRPKLKQRNYCFCNVLRSQHNGTSCWQPISLITMDLCWSRCWNLSEFIAQL